MTKKKIETAINEARIFGECFLGNVCFDTVKDSKKVNNYLSKNNIEDVSLYHCEDGWFMISMSCKKELKDRAANNRPHINKI